METCCTNARTRLSRSCGSCLRKGSRRLRKTGNEVSPFAVGSLLLLKCSGTQLTCTSTEKRHPKAGEGGELGAEGRSQEGTPMPSDHQLTPDAQTTPPLSRPINNDENDTGDVPRPAERVGQGVSVCRRGTRTRRRRSESGSWPVAMSAVDLRSRRSEWSRV